MFIYSKNIFISGKTIKITELTVKELKVLLKYILSIEDSPVSVFEALNTLILEKTDLTKNEICKLNFVDFFLILLHIRCISSSGVIKIITKFKEKKAEININLANFIDYLYELDTHTMLESDELSGNVVVTYRLPSILELVSTRSEISPCMFVKSIVIPATGEFVLEEYSINEKVTLYKKLPVSIALAVKKRANDIVDYFNKIDLLDYLIDVENLNLFFNFNIDNLIIFLQLLFNENLATLFENQFMLSKYGYISIDHIESCTPGEYGLYVGFLNRILNKKNEDSTEQDTSTDGDEDSKYDEQIE